MSCALSRRPHWAAALVCPAAILYLIRGEREVTIDKVQPLKIEDVESGGEETDFFPTALDPHEDHVECAGVVLDDATHRDETTRIWRSGSTMWLSDGESSGTLAQALSVTGSFVTPAEHERLRQLIHLADSGPYGGFTSEMYREVTGRAFPTSIVWYDSTGSLKKKIVEKLVEWSGPLATKVTYKAYDSSESLLSTVVDVVSYSGSFEVSRIRTVS